jgi:hypothetical protein
MNNKAKDITKNVMSFFSVEKQNSQLKGRNGFPLQATCFPVGERRAASSATAPFRGSPVSLSHGSQVAFHSNLQKCYLFSKGFQIK